jgi:hypothetical protein
MTASFLLLKVKIFLAEQKPEELHNAMEQLIQICDQCDFKLLKAQALAFIIKNKCMVENDDFCKGLRDQFLKIVSETGFREESFTDTAAIMTRK